jgi:hypothetical protein
MKNAVLLDVTSCGTCKNRRFGGTYHHHQGDISSARASVASCNVILSSPILDTLMMEAIRSS